MRPVKLAFYARLALILHAVILILFIMYMGKTVFIPLFFGFLVAMLLYPLMRRLEKVGIPRGVAAILLGDDDVDGSILVHVPDGNAVNIDHVGVDRVLDPDTVSTICRRLPPGQASRRYRSGLVTFRLS